MFPSWLYSNPSTPKYTQLPIGTRRVAFAHPLKVLLYILAWEQYSWTYDCTMYPPPCIMHYACWLCMSMQSWLKHLICTGPHVHHMLWYSWQHVSYLAPATACKLALAIGRAHELTYQRLDLENFYQRGPGLKRSGPIWTVSQEYLGWKGWGDGLAAIPLALLKSISSVETSSLSVQHAPGHL